MENDLFIEKESKETVSRWKQFSSKWSEMCFKLFPSGFMKELILLMQLAVPVILTTVFRYLNPIISIIVCGHLTKVEFNAASLANSLINVLGVSIDQGFSVCFDTLFAQFYGAGQKMKMGALLQRASLIMTMLFLILACIHININPLLILIKQNPLVAELTTTYLTLFLPGLFFDFQFLVISRFLQNQNIAHVSTICALCSNIFNIVFQPIFVHALGYGIRASAIIQALSYFTSFVIQLGYVFYSKIYVDSWPGFSRRAFFQNWTILILMGIPGILMISIPEWNFEIATFIAGALSKTQLGAQSIAFQICTINNAITFGFIIAVSIRVGQYLGMNDIPRLKTSYRTGLCFGLILNTIKFSFTMGLKHYLPKIFTTNPEILDLGEKIIIVAAFTEYSDLFAMLPKTILNATGKQGKGAIIMLICNYLIGVPIGVVLTLLLIHDVRGMWLGMIISSSSQGFIVIIMNSRIYWEEECDKANKNTHAKSIVGSIAEDKVSVLLEREDLCLLETSEDKPHIDCFPVKLLSVVFVILLFIGSVLLRHFLPKTLYLPCIERTNFSMSLYKNDMNLLCGMNSTSFT